MQGRLVLKRIKPLGSLWWAYCKTAELHCCSMAGEPGHQLGSVRAQSRGQHRRVQNRFVVNFGQPCYHTHITEENFRHIQQRVLDELLDESPDFADIPISFSLTSIYDHSLHEAFSRALQKLIGSLPYMEDLLNVFCGVRVSCLILRVLR